MAFLPFLSGLCGWVYFIAWSLSFYPQAMLNLRRRSTTGTTVDFHLINCLGFLAYTVSNLAFYYSPLIRAQYASRYNGLVPTVAFNDVTFALHGFTLSVVTTSQYLAPALWPGLSTTSHPGRRPSRFILVAILACVSAVAAALALVLGSPDRDSPDAGGLSVWCWLDVIYAISYVKVLVTLVKYTPQMYLNYRNQSTAGWSISQILLDLVGGVFSLAQLGIDSYMQRDWSGVTGNPVKFALSNIAFLYDGVFITQHYVLYRGAEGKEADEVDSLLAADERGADEEAGR